MALPLAGGLFALLFDAATEWLFWTEFSSQFNFIAVDYLIYTNEVIGNIRESYAIGWILGGLGALSLLAALSVRLWAARRLSHLTPLKFRLAGFAIHALLATHPAGHRRSRRHQGSDQRLSGCKSGL